MAKVITENATANTTKINQSVQQATEKAAETGLLNDPIFLATIIAAILVGIIAIALSKYSGKNEEKLFQGKSLQERLKEKQINPAMEFGDTTGKKVDYGLSELGRLEKFYKTTEVTSNDILDDIHNKDPEETEIDDLELSEENNQFKNLTLVVGPTGKLSRFKMKLKSNDPLKNDYLSVYSVPKSSVSNNDRVIIDDEKVDWNYSGGIYYSKDVQGITTMYSFSSLSLIDDLTEVFADKGEMTQALNEKFAEWKGKKQVENEAFINYMKEKEDIDSDTATD